MIAVTAGTQHRTDLAGEILMRFGSARIRVQGSSMLPSIRPGDEIELRTHSLQGIKVGDLVAYRRDDRLFVHRVIKKTSLQLVTRGDALPQADVPVSESELMGVVTAVRRNGKSASFQSTLTRRAAASLFRSSRLCAAFFVKFAAL